MAKMKYLVIHCTDTGFNQQVTPDDICAWHKGALKNSDGTFTFLGKIVSAEELKKLILFFPSGKQVPANLTNGRGWSKVGYADMITRNGDLINLTPYNYDAVIDSSEVTNGAAGYNSESRHVVLCGGWSEDGKIKNGLVDGKNLFKPEQLYTAKQLERLKNYVGVQKKFVPSVIVKGHNELASKTCPNFSVKEWLKTF